MSVDHAIPSTATDHQVGAREYIAVLLMLGSVALIVLPYGLLQAVLVWTIGAGVTWSSQVWTDREKLLGTLVWPGGLIGPFLLSTSVGQVCTQVAEGGVGGQIAADPVCTGFAFSPWVGVPLALLIIGAPFVVAARLLQRG